MDRDIYRVCEALMKDENFKNIRDMENFATKLFWAYWKDCDIPQEIKKAGLWIYANPSRQKKNYKRFLVNWFSRVRS